MLNQRFDPGQSYFVVDILKVFIVDEKRLPLELQRLDFIMNEA